MGKTLLRSERPLWLPSHFLVFFYYHTFQMSVQCFHSLSSSSQRSALPTTLKQFPPSCFEIHTVGKLHSLKTLHRPWHQDRVSHNFPSAFSLDDSFPTLSPLISAALTPGPSAFFPLMKIELSQCRLPLNTSC